MGFASIMGDRAFPRQYTRDRHSHLSHSQSPKFSLNSDRSARLAIAPFPNNTPAIAPPIYPPTDRPIFPSTAIALQDGDCTANTVSTDNRSH